MRFAFLLNLFFAIFELIGGIWANSFSIVSNAIHDFGDSATIGIGLVLEKKSLKSKNSIFTYGHRRWSLVASLIMSAVLSVGSLAVILESIQKLFSSEAHQPDSQKMFFFAIVGVIINAISFTRLSLGSGSHDKMMSLHMLEDMFGWVAVLVGAVVIYFFQLVWVDPLLSLFISAFVLFNVFKHLKTQINLILQITPDGFLSEEFLKEIKKIEGVLDVHDLHAWSLDGHENIMSLHVKIENLEASESIKNKIRNCANKLGHFHLTIEIESSVEQCKDVC